MGMQCFPLAQSASRRHATQPPPLQNGAAVLVQSASAAHSTQMPSVPHTLPVWVAQSTFERHATQVEVAVSHTGVSPEHWALLVHPVMQVNVRGLQMGRAAPQSPLPRQATHWPRAAKHRGNAGVGAQSGSAAQATHCEVAAKQTLSLPRQSAAELQPRQAPLPALQIGVADGHDDESVQG
jgi:hypothetical protein